MLKLLDKLLMKNTKKSLLFLKPYLGVIATRAGSGHPDQVNPLFLFKDADVISHEGFSLNLISKVDSPKIAVFPLPYLIV